MSNMSVNPSLRVHTDESWTKFAFEHTDSDYENIGIAPGAFYSPTDDTVHCSHTVFMLACIGVAWALKLLVHEFGHAAKWPKSDHPTNLIPAKDAETGKRDWSAPSGIGHALRVGFDVRAYSRFLRLRTGNLERWTAGYNWFTAQRELIEAGA